MNGPHRVFDGWVGAGTGANYCNLCSCHKGKLACRKKVCGWSHGLRKNGQECSHTFCTFGYTAESPNEKVMNIVHHHLEEHGVNSHCNYNKHEDKCSCHCWTSEADYLDPDPNPREAAGSYLNGRQPHHTNQQPRNNFVRPIGYESGKHWHHLHDSTDRAYELTVEEARNARDAIHAEALGTRAFQKGHRKQFGLRSHGEVIIPLGGAAGIAWAKAELARKAAIEEAANPKPTASQVHDFFADKTSSEPTFQEALDQVRSSEAQETLRNKYVRTGPLTRETQASGRERGRYM